MNIALLGCGTVGKAFYGLCTGREGFNITRTLYGRTRPNFKCSLTHDFNDILADQNINLVVEAIGGVEPAFSYVASALKSGKHIVTANKQLMCAHYDELITLARQNGVSLRCTAAAGGGIPWLPAISSAAKLDSIISVEGILNGTTNYILSAMTNQHIDYNTCLKQAQQSGYAEADPTADVEGLDARRKLVLSANLAFGVSIKEEDIPCFGISQISPKDIEAFDKMGCACKLYTYAIKNGDKICAFVMPTLFSRELTQASVSGTGNTVCLCGETMGALSLSGAGAGGCPTAYSLIRDCVEIERGCEDFYVKNHSLATVDNGGFYGDFYLRTGKERQMLKNTSLSDVLLFAQKANEKGENVFIARVYPKE